MHGNHLIQTRKDKRMMRKFRRRDTIRRELRMDGTRNASQEEG